MELVIEQHEERFYLTEILKQALWTSESAELTYAKVKRQVEGFLREYPSNKMSLEVVLERHLPSMVPKYDERPVVNQEIPILRDVLAAFDEGNFREQDKEQAIMIIHNVLCESRPELVQTNSSTERSVLNRLDPQKIERLKMKQAHVNLIENNVLPLLSQVENKVITDLYLKAQPIDKAALSKELDRSERWVEDIKKAAIKKIARILNLI